MKTLSLAFLLTSTAIAQTGWSLGPEQRLDSSAATFGSPVASDGAVLAVGAPFEDVGNFSQVGAVFLLRRSAGGWVQQQRLEPFDLPAAGQAEWAFGDALDVQGELVVVGAPSHDGVCNGTFWCNSGMAYVFENVAGTWVPAGLTVPPNHDDNDKLGMAVAVAGDQIIVSAPGDEDAGVLAGAVYVFERGASGWTMVQKLFPSDAQPRIQFGTSLKVDGDVLVVGGTGHRQGGASNGAARGSAYVFRRNAGAWTEEAALLPEAFHHEMRFGSSVDVSGEHIAVGASGRNSNNTKDGAAYTFERIAGTWTRTQILTPPNALFEDRFGIALALHGGRLAVGKYNNSVSSPRDVQVYDYVNGAWAHVFELTSQNPYPADFLGRSVAMTGDGMFFGWSTAAYAFDIHVLSFTFCVTFPNSTGAPGRLSATGQATLGANNVVLTASDLPTQSFGFLLVSDVTQAAGSPAGSAGALCLGGAVGRYVGPGQVQSTGGTGAFSTAIDLSAVPRPTGLVSAAQGESWHFQAWHRDAVGGTSTSNFTEGLTIVVQ